MAVLRSKAGQAAKLIRVHLPAEGKAVTRESFRFELDADAFRDSGTRHGAYLLRTNLNDPEAAPAGLEAVAGDAPALWSMYMQLVWVEAAFRSLKSDLGIRPIYHQLQGRVEAHILVAFLGYAMTALLRKKLSSHAPGLTPAAVLEIDERDPDGGRVHPHDRRPLADHAAPHRAGAAARDAAGAPGPDAAAAAAAADSQRTIAGERSMN